MEFLHAGKTIILKLIFQKLYLKIRIGFIRLGKGLL